MENDKTNETIDSTNDAEIVDTESIGTETDGGDAQSQTEVDVSKLQETNRKLFERAKKAETELKTYKQGNSPKVNNENQQTASPSNIDVDERILKANGMPTELLSQLKDIAALRKVNLIDAQTDDLFVAVKAKFEKDEKHKAASVGASRSSGSVKVSKTLSSPGLSREEHMKLVKEGR